MTPSNPALAILCVLLAVGGCTTRSMPTSGELPPSHGSGTGTVPPIYPEIEAQPEPVPDQPRSDASLATLALLRDSERAQAAGDTDRATAYVERAIRLEPRRADLWIELARLQLPARAIAAERYARKALTLAGSRLDLQRDAWPVIADAKQANGEQDEAKAIRERYRSYRG